MSRRSRINNLQGWLFIMPAALIFSLFIFAPMGVALFISLQEWNMMASMEFVGLSNYAEMFQSDHFWNAFRISILYVIGTVPVTVALGIVLAIMLNSIVHAVSLLRIMIYLPVITSMAAAAIVFQYIFEPTFGLANHVLQSLGLPRLMWLNDPTQALVAVVIVGIWKRVGYNTIILLAGLQAIPSYYYEAAIIDGASKMQMIRRITIPLLSAVTFFVTVMQIIASMRVFTSIVIMTAGGPARGTDVLPYFLYRNAFQYFRMGYASAIAYFLFAVIFLFTLLQFTFGEKRVHYQ